MLKRILIGLVAGACVAGAVMYAAAKDYEASQSAVRASLVRGCLASATDLTSAKQCAAAL